MSSVIMTTLHLLLCQVYLQPDFVSGWSGVTGPLKELEFWTPWAPLDFISALKGGGRAVPLRSVQLPRGARRSKTGARFFINAFPWSYLFQGISSSLLFPKAARVLILLWLLEIISFAPVLILSKRTVFVDQGSQLVLASFWMGVRDCSVFIFLGTWLLSA